MDINEAVARTFNQMVENGAIEKIIEEKLTKCMDDIIGSAFRSYGEIGKKISEKVNASIEVGKVELPEYNHFVARIIEEQYGKIMEANAAKHLQELVLEHLKPVEKETKISSLLAEVSEHWGEEARVRGSDYIDIQVSYNDDETAIYTKFKHPEFDFDDIDVTFYDHRKTGKFYIGYIHENGSVITKTPTSRCAVVTSGPLGVFYKYWAMGTVFEMDEDVDSIYVGY